MKMARFNLNGKTASGFVVKTNKKTVFVKLAKTTSSLIYSRTFPYGKTIKRNILKDQVEIMPENIVLKENNKC